MRPCWPALTGPVAHDARVRAGTRPTLRSRWAPRAWCAARARRRPPSVTSCSPTPARRAPLGARWAYTQAAQLRMHIKGVEIDGRRF